MNGIENKHELVDSSPVNGGKSVYTYYHTFHDALPQKVIDAILGKSEKSGYNKSKVKESQSQNV
jgi:hypothetical protein